MLAGCCQAGVWQPNGTQVVKAFAWQRQLCREGGCVANFDSKTIQTFVTTFTAVFNQLWDGLWLFGLWLFDRPQARI